MKILNESLNELKNVRVLAICGIFMALSVALKFVASIDIGQYIRIGVSDLPGMAVSALFGPAVGGIFWGLLDIIKYIVAPTGPYFPGFTLSAVLNGVIFGAILYKKNITYLRVFMAQFVSKVVVSLAINTAWLSMLYGNAYLAMLPARLVTNAIMLPIDTVLMYMVVTFVYKMWNRETSMA